MDDDMMDIDVADADIVMADVADADAVGTGMENRLGTFVIHRADIQND
jgi:hypothetical protein